MGGGGGDGGRRSGRRVLLVRVPRERQKRGWPRSPPRASRAPRISDRGRPRSGCREGTRDVRDHLPCREARWPTRRMPFCARTAKILAYWLMSKRDASARRFTLMTLDDRDDLWSAFGAMAKHAAKSLETVAVAVASDPNVTRVASRVRRRAPARTASGGAAGACRLSGEDPDARKRGIARVRVFRDDRRRRRRAVGAGAHRAHGARASLLNCFASICQRDSVRGGTPIGSRVEKEEKPRDGRRYRAFARTRWRRRTRRWTSSETVKSRRQMVIRRSTSRAQAVRSGRGRPSSPADGAPDASSAARNSAAAAQVTPGRFTPPRFGNAFGNAFFSFAGIDRGGASVVARTHAAPVRGARRGRHRGGGRAPGGRFGGAANVSGRTRGGDGGVGDRRARVAFAGVDRVTRRARRHDARVDRDRARAFDRRARAGDGGGRRRRRRRCSGGRLAARFQTPPRTISRRSFRTPRCSPRFVRW